MLCSWIAEDGEADVAEGVGEADDGIGDLLGGEFGLVDVYGDEVGEDVYAKPFSAVPKDEFFGAGDADEVTLFVGFVPDAFSDGKF